MSRVTLFADVIVPLAVPKKYTYRVPDELNEELMPGKRVLVQFGKSRLYTAVVYAVHEKAPVEYAAKYIEGLLDDRPIVTDIQIKFWDWLAFYYCANPGDVMNAALPSGLKLSSTSHAQLHPDFDFENKFVEFSEKEQLLLDSLRTRDHLSFNEISELLKIKNAQTYINKLIQKGAIVLFEDVQEKYKPKLQTFLQLTEEHQSEQQLQNDLNLLEKKAFKQAEALLYFLHLQKTQEQDLKWISKSEMLKKSENSAIAGLIKKNILREQDFEISRLLFEKAHKKVPVLSSAQQSALLEIRENFEKNKPVLLHGVTGSGKTEIYIQLVREALEKNEQVLYLIPEIALTTQLIGRMRAVFGEIVGVYHSRFSENERVEIWNNLLDSRDRQIKNQKSNSKTVKTNYQIILGARSSLFLPFDHLGLIIVDEEHEQSFKQRDPSPRYHARDAALYLGSLHKSKIVLGSATPSVESYYNSMQGKYALVKLNEQYVKGGGTEMEICDLLFYSQSNQMKASLSPPLFSAVEKALAEKKQVILFQNRRGFAPYTECKKCGHVPKCVQCDVSMIFHKQQQKLVCHYCGYTCNPPTTCAACGSNQLHYKGQGTEKIEEDIEILFPKARIARMDLDSTRSKYAFKQLIDNFEAGQIDILIGTQMVSKGLDFKNVNVVGVISADSILNFPDFRSFERGYQLLTQVRGRAGRHNEKGKVYIQTSQPGHKVISYVKNADYESFAAETLAERQQFDYPPYSRLFELNVISKDLNEVNHLAQELLVLLKAAFAGHLLGPEFPLVSKIKNQFYKRILIKIPKTMGASAARTFIENSIDTLQNKHKDWVYRIAVDADPV